MKAVTSARIIAPLRQYFANSTTECGKYSRLDDSGSAESYSMTVGYICIQQLRLLSAQYNSMYTAVPKLSSYASSNPNAFYTNH